MRVTFEMFGITDECELRYRDGTVSAGVIRLLHEGGILSVAIETGAGTCVYRKADDNG